MAVVAPSPSPYTNGRKNGLRISTTPAVRRGLDGRPEAAPLELGSTQHADPNKRDGRPGIMAENAPASVNIFRGNAPPAPEFGSPSYEAKRQENIARSRANGTFDSLRDNFNNQASSSWMDTKGNIGPRDPASGSMMAASNVATFKGQPAQGAPAPTTPTPSPAAPGDAKPKVATMIAAAPGVGGSGGSSLVHDSSNTVKMPQAPQKSQADIARSNVEAARIRAAARQESDPRVASAMREQASAMEKDGILGTVGAITSQDKPTVKMADSGLMAQGAYDDRIGVMQRGTDNSVIFRNGAAIQRDSSGNATLTSPYGTGSATTTGQTPAAASESTQRLDLPRWAVRALNGGGMPQDGQPPTSTSTGAGSTTGEKSAIELWRERFPQNLTPEQQKAADVQNQIVALQKRRADAITGRSGETWNPTLEAEHQKKLDELKKQDPASQSAPANDATRTPTQPAAPKTTPADPQKQMADLEQQIRDIEAKNPPSPDTATQAERDAWLQRMTAAKGPVHAQMDVLLRQMTESAPQDGFQPKSQPSTREEAMTMLADIEEKMKQASNAEKEALQAQYNDLLKRFGIGPSGPNMAQRTPPANGNVAMFRAGSS